MMPLQPRPAGLPSGTIGRAGGRRTTHRWMQRLLAQPARPPMLLACAALALTGLWWAAMVVARAAGWPLPWQVPPVLAHVLAIGWGVMPPVVVALLAAAGPRWLGLGAVPARLLLLPVGLMGAGMLLVLPGVHLSRTVAGLGLAVAAVGLALAMCLWGLLVLESRGRWRRQAGVVVAGGLLMAVCQWGSALMLVLGRPQGAQAAWAGALWAGLVPILAVLAWRLRDVLATADASATALHLAAAADADRRGAGATSGADPTAAAFADVGAGSAAAARGGAGPAVLPGIDLPVLSTRWPLLLAAIAWLGTPLVVARVGLGGGPAALGTLNLLGLPLAAAGLALVLTSALWLGRLVRRARGPAPGMAGQRLPAMLALAGAWLGLAWGLQGAAHALAGLDDAAGLLGSDWLHRVVWPLALSQASDHALAMGFVATALMALATHLARSAAGRRIEPDNWTWMMLGALQVAALARVASALWPSAATPLSLLAAQFWLAALGVWALRHGRWFMRQADTSRLG